MPSPQDHRDQGRFAGLAGLLIACALTGYATFWIGRGAIWEQWTYLVHTVQGLVLTVLLSSFVYLHYRRTVGVKRPALSLTGILVVLVAAAFVGAGLYLAVFGQTESTRTVYWIHVLAGSVALLATLGHVVWHRASLPSHRRDPAEAVVGIRKPTRRSIAWNSGLAASAVLVGSLAYGLLPSPYADRAAVEPYALPYGENVYAPSHNQTTSGGFYDAKRFVGAERCGACHTEIYADWRASMHSHAASDKAYEASLDLLVGRQGLNATRYCEGCHAPAAMMNGQLADGGRLDTPERLVEGVTCLGCHGIRRVLDTSGVASYLWAPPATYLFAGYESFAARELHDYVVRLNPALHRRDMARPPLHTPELCATCHSQFMDKVTNHWGWVKMQDDYTGWLNGPFSGQSNHTFAQAATQRCQDCHFPLVDGSDPSADSLGRQRSHRLPGANTAIPFTQGDTQRVEFQTRFLQANRVTVTIDKPTREHAVRSDKPIQPEISDVTEPPGYFYLGDEVTLNTVVANVGVGHDFPGGTTDLNEVWVHLLVTDGQDRTVYESGGLDEHGNVDKDAYFYRSLLVDKEGKLIWRHDLFRMVGDSFKNVVKAGSSDVVTFHFTIPSWAKAPLSVSAVVRYRKLNARFARWALDDENLQLPIVDVASDSLSIPLRERLEAEDAARPSAEDGPTVAPAPSVDESTAAAPASSRATIIHAAGSAAMVRPRGGTAAESSPGTRRSSVTGVSR